jgi:hypothetical protein
VVEVLAESKEYVSHAKERGLRGYTMTNIFEFLILMLKKKKKIKNCFGDSFLGRWVKKAIELDHLCGAKCSDYLIFLIFYFF